jgi:hypothetical protein
MRVAIVGSREWTDYLLFESLLETVLVSNDIPVTEIVSGGAQGADTFAEIWAGIHEIPVRIFLPGVGSDGRFIHPMSRNGDIVSHSDMIIAFPIGSSPGTRDTIRKARAAGVPVVIA